MKKKLVHLQHADKNTSLLKSLTLLLIFCLLNIGSSFGQSPTITPAASGVDNWFETPTTGSGSIIGLNTSHITSPGGDLYTAVWDDNAGSIYFTYSDLVSWSSNNAITVPQGYDIVFHPDITTGQDTASNNMYIAIIYLAQNMSSGAIDAFLDIYYVGPPGGGFGLISSQTRIPLTNTGTIDFAFPHIDAITEQTGIATTICTRFVCCWQDMSHNMYGLAGEMGAFLIGGYVPINTVTLPFTGHDPDVAGVQRGTAMSHGIFGVFDYVTMLGNLRATVWDIGLSSTTSSLPIDNGVMEPRIDAVDPYSIANLTNVDRHDMVYTKYNGSNTYLRSYSNVVGGGACVGIVPMTDDAVYPGWTASTPQVAYQQISGSPTTQYNVAFSANPGTDLPYSMTNNGTTGCLASTTWYEIDAGPGFQTLPWQVAISQQQNTLTPFSTFACYYNVNDGNIYYKINTTAPTSYRPGEENGNTITNANSNGKWSVMPNPAYDVITLKTNDNAAGTAYQVTDLAGRVVLSSSIQGIENSIQLDKLTKGMYMISVFDNDRKLQTIKFVKE